MYTFFQPDEDARIARCRGKVSTFRRIPKELVLLLLQFIRPFDPFFILAGRVQVQQAANDESVVVEKSVNRLGAVNRVGGIQYSNEPEKKKTQQWAIVASLLLLRDILFGSSVAAAHESSTLRIVQMLAHEFSCFGGPLDVSVFHQGSAGFGEGRYHQTWGVLSERMRASKEAKQRDSVLLLLLAH